MYPRYQSYISKTWDFTAEVVYDCCFYLLPVLLGFQYNYDMWKLNVDHNSTDLVPQSKRLQIFQECLQVHRRSFSIVLAGRVWGHRKVMSLSFFPSILNTVINSVLFIVHLPWNTPIQFTKEGFKTCAKERFFFLFLSRDKSNRSEDLNICTL